MIFMVNSILVTEVIGCWTQKKILACIVFSTKNKAGDKLTNIWWTQPEIMEWEMLETPGI